MSQDRGGKGRAGPHAEGRRRTSVRTPPAELSGEWEWRKATEHTCMLARRGVLAVRSVSCAWRLRRV